MSDLTLYKLYRPQMRSGDLIEWGSATAIGSMIRLFTRKHVNHSSLLLNLDHFSGLKDRRFVLEALEHGVELNLLSKRLKEFKGWVYWSALKPEYNDRRDAIASWALNRVGTEYDYSSLFANMFGAVSQDAKDFFCSEYYHMALASEGILPGGKAARPGGFESFGVHEKAVRIF